MSQVISGTFRGPSFPQQPTACPLATTNIHFKVTFINMFGFADDMPKLCAYFSESVPLSKSPTSKAFTHWIL